MTIEEINKMCSDIAAAEGVDITCPIKINGRLKSTLGRVTYQWSETHAGQIEVKAIEFSKQHVTMGDPAEVRLTIIHEMTHYILFTKTGVKHGHDQMFKELNKKLGGDGETYSETPRINPKYTVYCTKCGKIVGEYYRAGRVVKNPESTISRCCAAAIKVVQNY